VPQDLSLRDSPNSQIRSKRFRRGLQDEILLGRREGPVEIHVGRDEDRQIRGIDLPGDLLQDGSGPGKVALRERDHRFFLG
jgi:hypothetical protein